MASMVDMFGQCAEHSTALLERAAEKGDPIEMENLFSRLALDVIGKAVFNYDFDSLTHDDPVIQVSLGFNHLFTVNNDYWCSIMNSIALRLMTTSARLVNFSTLPVLKL